MQSRPPPLWREEMPFELDLDGPLPKKFNLAFISNALPRN